MDNFTKIFFVILGILIVINIIIAIVFIARNIETKQKFSSFENKLNNLQKGMTQDQVIRFIGFEPLSSTTIELVYERKLHGFGSFTDHKTKRWNLQFDVNGGYTGYNTNCSSRKTITHYHY